MTIIRLVHDPKTRSFIRPEDAKPHRQRRPFIPAVPKPWFEAAADLPGKALAVGLIIRLEAALRQSQTITLTGAMTKGIDLPPSSRRRALASLEAAGLIRVDRQPRHNPVVTILERE